MTLIIYIYNFVIFKKETVKIRYHEFFLFLFINRKETMRPRNDRNQKYKSYFSLFPHPDYPTIDPPSPPPLEGEVIIGYMIFEPIKYSLLCPIYDVFFMLFSCCFKRKIIQKLYPYQFTVYKLNP
jgi:hypothetical protein